MRSMNLSLQDDIKEYAQKYAKEHGTNVSAIVERVFRFLRDFEEGSGEEKSRIARLRESLPRIEDLDSVDYDALRLQALQEKYLRD